MLFKDKNEFYSENNYEKTYFNEMINIEKNIWNKHVIKKLDKETKDLHKIMLNILNKLKLIYQVKYVSIYLMIITRSNWEFIIRELPKYFNRRSNNYMKNILIISCIFISSNYEELNPPSYNKLVEIIIEEGYQMKKNENIVRKHVHIIEKIIWKLIDFQIEIPSANSFLMQIIRYSQLPKKSIFNVSKISNEIINRSLNCDIISKYRQSIIALASFCLSVNIFFNNKEEKYINIALEYTGFSKEEVNKLKKKLEKLIK